MVNIWKYYDSGKIQLTTTDGKVYIGYVVSVEDTEETYDPEDSITIYAYGEYYGFLQSEIAEIEEL